MKINKFLYIIKTTSKWTIEVYYTINRWHLIKILINEEGSTFIQKEDAPAFFMKVVAT